jgi:phosphotriesterase-related protein
MLDNAQPSAGQPATAVVATARGPVEAGDLGVTLMHEHIFITSPEVRQNFPVEWDEEAEIGNAIDRLNELKASGVDTLVDLTVLGLGRYIPRIQRVAAGTALNIVVATGLYTYDDLPMFFHFRGPGTAFGGPETLTDLFVRDITEGILDTGVKAAILKCATDVKGVTPGVERVLRAVAAAHRATGAPISTHTHAESRRGLEQQDVFEQEGVDLSRVVIGHCGDTTDLDYLEELMRRGSYIGMDRFGLDPLLPFEARVATVARLCERGYADRIVLSHDAACVNDFVDRDLVARALPRWHYLHITHDVLPALRQRGVTEDQIRQMLVLNPRQIFSRTGAY